MSRDGNEAQRRPDRAALVIAAALAVAAVIIAVSTFRAGGTMAYTPVGPKTFPYIIAALLLVLAGFTAVEAWRGDFPEREPQQFGPMAWILGGLVVQMLTMKTVGFSISTGLLFAATAAGFGKRRVWLTVPFGIVFALLVWIVFGKGLKLSLPAGPVEQFISPYVDAVVAAVAPYVVAIFAAVAHWWNAVAAFVGSLFGG